MTTAELPQPVDLGRPADWYRAVARQHGYGTALASLHEEAGADTLLCGPSGYAVAPAPTAEGARRWRSAGTTADRAAGHETRATTVPLRALGLVAIRCASPPPASPSGYVPWALRLTWLRLGLSGALLDACTEYLRGRATGGEPMLSQQLIKGALADTVIAHLEAETVLSGGGVTLPELADVNGSITRTDRELLRLLGASGFTLDGPGRTAYVSEVLADAYIGPTGSGASL
jgi:hypothetical protein